MAELNPMIAALSFSDCRVRLTASARGMRRYISFRIIAGIIWKVDALPTPLTKKQDKEHGKKPWPTPYAEEVENTRNAGGHPDEHPEGDAGTAEPVGHPPGGRPRDRPDQRTEECEFQRIDSRKLCLGKKWKARRITDEGAEGSGVKPAHEPVMLALKDHRLFGEGCLHRGDVVHAEPGREGRCGDERNPYEAGILQP